MDAQLYWKEDFYRDYVYDQDYDYNYNGEAAAAASRSKSEKRIEDRDLDDIVKVEDGEEEEEIIKVNFYKR